MRYGGGRAKAVLAWLEGSDGGAAWSADYKLTVEYSGHRGVAGGECELLPRARYGIYRYWGIAVGEGGLGGRPHYALLLLQAEFVPLPMPVGSYYFYHRGG